jgi:DNA-binding PadR family transcriptional regulator
MSGSSTTQYAILGLLTIQPMSGYDLGKTLRETLSFFWTESNGQLYPSLRKLAAQKLIAPVSARQSGKRARQKYALTPSGRKHLRQWLAEPPQMQPVRNELALKLYLGRSAPPGALARHIESFQHRHEEALRAFMRLRECVPKENPDSPHLNYWMLCLERGIGLRQVELDWCSSTLKALAAAPKRKSPRRTSACA